MSTLLETVAGNVNATYRGRTCGGGSLLKRAIELGQARSKRSLGNHQFSSAEWADIMSLLNSWYACDPSELGHVSVRDLVKLLRAEYKERGPSRSTLQRFLTRNGLNRAQRSDNE